MLPRQLAIKLDQLKGFRRPKAHLEQWRTPGNIAAEMVFLAKAKGRKVLDLGCGTGILAIAANLMGASKTTGVELDATALELARENSPTLDIEWINDNVFNYQPTTDFEVVIMNPPYGSVVRSADKHFVESALKLAPEVYSLMSIYSREFFQKKYGAKVLKTFKFPLKNQQIFHKRNTKTMEVDLLVFKREA
ncbi:MAG: methyltransferase [Candidatus Altiarchaeota archaeon]|nr:methyltransferase [Candidatus Altiarchaeota archaeon]